MNRQTFAGNVKGFAISVVMMFSAAGTAMAQIGCYDCHGTRNPVDYRPVDSSYRNVTTGGFPGNHRRHMAAPDSPAACAPCHPGSAAYTTSHRDGLVKVRANINSSPVAARYKNSTSAFLQSPSPTLGTCSNVNCHFETTTPAWGSTPFATTNDCNKCHAAPPNDGTHAAHDSYYGPGSFSCGRCHADHAGEPAPFAHATSAGRRGLVLKGFNYSKLANTSYPNYLPSQTAGANRNGTCDNITCHGNTSATWGGVANAACLDCHSIAQGNRSAITPQFGGNSHHIQGTVTNARCYQCHWEANSDGSINSSYHHSKTPGGPVELVIYGAGARPATYAVGTTAVQYTANGTRNEIAKLNSHCLGCHSDQNNATQPFGDGKTPKQYAWDGTSVAARYTQTGVTTWGKYSTATNTANKRANKAFSAHGNAVANKLGWSSATGVDGKITDTSGSSNVLCFDCHNSHGSTVTGTTTRYASATVNGGILKDTTISQNGYAVAYKPYSGGSVSHKNKRNPGASLCLDCHLSQSATTTPWGYTSTFGTTQPILGYWDSPFMDGGNSAGPKQRFPYKGANPTMGGHFGASSPLSTTPQSAIGGLCTPCHDPHGVSPTLGANEQYAVPLLKGTWITSPYKEDTSPANNALYTGVPGYEGVQYHIDQNTFASGGVTQDESQSEGLCLGCHPKSSLTTTASPANPNAWKSKDRIHEAVKGWKTSDGTIQHSYTCSKCHAPHNDSVLPRLMVTNCLDGKHKGRSGFNPYAITSGSDSSDGGSGSGHIPGYYNSSGWGDYPLGPNPGYNGITCHESANANGGDGTNQSWNNVTPWVDSTPTAATGDIRVLMHMDEASWNGTPNEVIDSSGGNNHATAYNGASTVAGGISGRAGSFNGSNSVTINYASGIPPMDNFTIEAWIKPTTSHQVDPETNSGVYGTSGQNYLFWPDQRGAINGGAGISVGTNGISVYEHGDNYMPALAVYSGSINTTQWTHIAVVYQNKQPSIYVNGTLVHTGLQSVRAHVYAPQTIGFGSYGAYTGLVDEVAIFDSALPGSDILLHSQQLCTGSAAAVTIRWNTANASTSYVEYGLTTNYGSTTGNNSLVVSHSITLPGLTNHTTYHYRVRSTNASGIETISNDYTFTVETCTTPTTINSPVLTAQSNASSSGGSIAKTFQWSSVNASDGDAAQYLVEVSSASNFATIAYSSGWQAGTSWTQSLPLGTWYWRVTARDSAHTTTVSNPSASNSFSINYAVPPAPTATHQPDVTGSLSANITFGWSSVTAADGDAIQYLVEVSSASNFATIAYNSGWQTGTSWTQTLPSGTWYWRTTARDSVHTSAVSAASATDSFTISAPAPSSPTLTAQPTTFVIGSGATTSITFGWSAVTAPDGDGVQYQVDVSNTLTFGTISYQSSWQTGANWTQTLPVGTLYWRVKARDSVHTTAQSTSTSNSFGVVDRTPAVPTLVHNAGANATSASITFQWNSVASPDSDAVQYWVDVSLASNFSTIDYSTPAWQTGTSWTQALPQGTYYWRVRARDSIHTTAVSNNSASDSFMIAPQISWTVPGSFNWSVPTGITSITVTLAGGGGAGGLEDNVGNQTVGTSGDLVSTIVAVTPGTQLSVYVGSGGAVASIYDPTPGAGGTGYHPGVAGVTGEGTVSSGAWSYGGAGGGGSSAVTLSATLLTEAKGGAGGRSSDYDDYDNCSGDCGYYYGGNGGAGGGSDYPTVTTIGGGGSGGSYGQIGGNGSVIISW